MTKRETKPTLPVRLWHEVGHPVFKSGWHWMRRDGLTGIGRFKSEDEAIQSARKYCRENGFLLRLHDGR